MGVGVCVGWGGGGDIYMGVAWCLVLGEANSGLMVKC